MGKGLTHPTYWSRIKMRGFVGGWFFLGGGKKDAQGGRVMGPQRRRGMVEVEGR